MQAGVEQHGEVGAVVDDERGAVLTAETGDVPSECEEIASPVAFVADLKNAGAALQERRGGGFNGDAATVERFRIEYRINARELHGIGESAPRVEARILLAADERR